MFLKCCSTNKLLNANSECYFSDAKRDSPALKLLGGKFIWTSKPLWSERKMNCVWAVRFVNLGLANCVHFCLFAFFFQEASFYWSLLKLIMQYTVIFFFSGKICWIAFIKGQFFSIEGTLWESVFRFTVTWKANVQVCCIQSYCSGLIIKPAVGIYKVRLSRVLGKRD